MLTIDSNFTTIIAWRHGEINANNQHSFSGATAKGDKFNLNETGKQQATKLAQQIFKEYPKLEYIYSSDLQRAIDTSTIVMKQYPTSQIKLSTTPQLREIYHGKYEGNSDTERNQNAEEQCSNVPKIPIEDRYQFWRVHPVTKKSVKDDVPVIDIAKAEEEKNPDPETVYELYKRGKAIFIDIAKKHPGQTIAFSSHGGLLGTLAEDLRYEGQDVVLPPYFVKRQHSTPDRVIMPAASKVSNCAILRFRYQHDTGKLILT